MSKTHDAVAGKGSTLGKYQDVMVGSRGLGKLLYFEWCMLLSPVPGALGIILRKLFWPRLFGVCGGGCMFASGIVLRRPGRIFLGRAVVISERCVLDGRGTGERAIELGDNVMLSNDITLSCKEGSITIGANTGINTQAIVQSTHGCPVVIGEDCILGQRSLVIAGGNYNSDDLEKLIREQGIQNDGGIELAGNVWLGANVSVLGGVKMGRGSIAGTGAVVTRSVPENVVCLGVPAKVVKRRGE